MQKTMMTISPGDGRALLFMLFPFLDTSLESPGSTILPLLVLLSGPAIKTPSESAQDWIKLSFCDVLPVRGVLLLNRESIVWRREESGV